MKGIGEEEEEKGSSCTPSCSVRLYAMTPVLSRRTCVNVFMCKFWMTAGGSGGSIGGEGKKRKEEKGAEKSARKDTLEGGVQRLCIGMNAGLRGA